MTTRTKGRPDVGTWLTKAQTCEALQLSPKSIEKLAQEKELQHAMYRRPTGGQPIIVYNPDDVTRIARQRNPGPTPFVLPPGAAATVGSQALTVGRVTPASGDGLHAFLQALGADVARPEPKLFLTIEEAAAVTGLTRAYLLRAIEAGTLPAIRDE